MGRAAGTTTVAELHRALRADGPATVLAIGTANPATCIPQDAYPDYYFRITKSEHKKEIKERLKNICEKSGTVKRHFHHDEALLAAHPEFIDPAAPSLDARLEIVRKAVPELAAAACRKAIAEWGRPAAEITHLVVTTNSGAHVPGVDFQLVHLLGLRPTVRRTMIHLNACFAGAAALRLAKDLAENSRGARVLVVCAELTLLLFDAPEEGNFNTLIHMGLFGDGAGAVILGADPAPARGERPLFEVAAAAQNIIPDTEHAMGMKFSAGGLSGSSTTRKLPELIGDNIERCLADAVAPLGIRPGWNDLFWVVHPGTAGILDGIEARLHLKHDKLAASRQVLRDYGNMFGVTIIFVLDELRRRSAPAPQGDLDWGVLMAFGPGITVETMVLRAVSSNLKGNLGTRAKL